MELALALAWCVVVAVLIVRAFGQRNALRRLEPAADPQDCAKVAFIVPARDEAANIGACLASLTAQSCSGARPSIVVVDDHSSDATAAIVAAAADADSCVRLMRAPSLPPGWTGKSHACWIAARALPRSVEWLCFMDADVRAEPMAISSALAEADSERLDFLSLAPRQELVSFAERLVMPCGLYLLAFTQDLRLVQGPNGKATATGQFIQIRRSVYESVGGHASVAAEICEDVELARRVKLAGFRVLLEGGDSLLATRMYEGWRSLWLGVSKNLVDMLGGPISTLMTAFLAVVLAWSALALPILDLVACRGGRQEACAGLALALPASAAALGLHMAGAGFFRIPLWYGLLFPLGYSAGAGMALDSVRRRLSGRTRWKGRTYP